MPFGTKIKKYGPAVVINEGFGTALGEKNMGSEGVNKKKGVIFFLGGRLSIIKKEHSHRPQWHVRDLGDGSCDTKKTRGGKLIYHLEGETGSAYIMGV